MYILSSSKNKNRFQTIPVEHQLSSALYRGSITLVLGAGISMPRGIPNWESLAKQLWEKCFGKRNSPWKCKNGSTPRQISQFLPMVFELVYNELGEDRFLNVLRKELYYNVKYPGDDPKFKKSYESLAVLARLILQEYNRKFRRIDTIITFNADDFIEQAIYAVAGLKKSSPFTEIVRVIARATHSQSNLKRGIPLYHIHGFLPSNHVIKYSKFDHMLVFTDAQYWSTSASALTFANRIMSSALSEGRCIFIGLSMTDINLLRWMALRNIELNRDIQEIERNQKSGINPEFLHRIFQRHFWIRPASDDPNGFLTKFFNIRGINSVEIKDWTGNSFQKLIEKCFSQK